MARVRIESVHGPVRRRIGRGLHAYNCAQVGKHDRKPLTITMREGETIVAGLTGCTALGWLFIDWLWVADERRRKGLGRALVAKAESEAQKRGARNAYLNTFSFQAPGFDQKLGYREFGRLDNFPSGHARHWMSKAL